MKDARCAGNLYFTETPIAYQKAECALCDVRAECREFGLGQISGDKKSTVVYGGLTDRERLTIKKQRRILRVVR
jgi:hypothetical protein